jgi:hypothetical protein
VNPYRGCLHACAYCLSGDTQILMGDGRPRPIAALSVGDEIYGTRLVGRYRRYVKARVLAHWASIKPAYRILLEDSTELVASADHRFPSNRGWKYVTGTESGRARRPHLTTRNDLLGAGAFASAHADSRHHPSTVCDPGDPRVPRPAFAGATHRLSSGTLVFSP